MARFRVQLRTEQLYIEVVEADSAADAGKLVGDKVRAGQLGPFFDRPSVFDVRIRRLEDLPGDH